MSVVFKKANSPQEAIKASRAENSILEIKCLNSYIGNVYECRCDGYSILAFVQLISDGIYRVETDLMPK